VEERAGERRFFDAINTEQRQCIDTGSPSPGADASALSPLARGEGIVLTIIWTC
jgi:hypothetical protein